MCINGYLTNMATKLDTLVRTNIHLTERIRRWLREVQARTGCPPAVTVRRVLDEAMAADKSKHP